MTKIKTSTKIRCDWSFSLIDFWSLIIHDGIKLASHDKKITEKYLLKWDRQLDERTSRQSVTHRDNWTYCRTDSWRQSDNWTNKQTNKKVSHKHTIADVNTETDCHTDRIGETNKQSVTQKLDKQVDKVSHKRKNFHPVWQLDKLIQI